MANSTGTLKGRRLQNRGPLAKRLSTNDGLPVMVLRSRGPRATDNDGSWLCAPAPRPLERVALGL